jgi:glyoxylase-like metal-dependent hydrolase (beta-lactamase superfamily II)
LPAARDATSLARVRAALITVFTIGCAHSGNTAVAPSTGPVSLSPIAANVYVHTSWGTVSAGTCPANGLLVCEPGAGLLVDTPWTNAQTDRLLSIARQRGCPVRALIVTHSHDDRMGGIDTVLRRGIATYATRATVALAGRDRWSPGIIDSPGLVRVGDAAVEVFFPGEAHTADNVVVWLGASRVLFGGCMIRAAAGDTLGNTADGNVAAYAESVRRVIERYGEAERVVPGHGDPGGRELLAHTLSLAEAARRSPPPRPIPTR